MCVCGCEFVRIKLPSYSTIRYLLRFGLLCRNIRCVLTNGQPRARTTSRTFHTLVAPSLCLCTRSRLLVNHVRGSPSLFFSLFFFHAVPYSPVITMNLSLSPFIILLIDPAGARGQTHGFSGCFHARRLPCPGERLSARRL